MWKAVETKAKKTGMAEVKRGSRKETREEGREKTKKKSRRKKR